MEEPQLKDDEIKYLAWKGERQQRLRIVMFLLPALLGISSYMYGASIEVMSSDAAIYSRTLKSIGIGALAISGITGLMAYLQTGFKKTSVDHIGLLKHEEELRDLKNQLKERSTVSLSLVEKIQIELSELSERVKTRESIDGAIENNQKDEIVKLLKSEIVKEASSDAASNILKSIEDKLKRSNDLKDIEGNFSRTIERLTSETSALSRRGNLNLTLGIVTTIVGLGILGYFVLEIDSIPEDKAAFVAHFIPRLSLVVLIEVFAYFFLKLYKSSLSEIKYFQNELTNVEAKLSAIKCSFMTSDSTITSQVIQSLSVTERNAVLDKGQTTAEIEKAKIEQQNISTISEKVSNLLHSKKNA